MKEREPVKIKICGLTRACDMDYVNEAMPDYAGFVFAKSRRQVDLRQAALLRSRLKEGITAVGVFVDAEEEEMLFPVREGILSMLQLHGKETPEQVRSLKEKAGCPVIKAVRLEEGPFPETFYRAYEAAGLDGFLFDSGRTGTARTAQDALSGEAPDTDAKRLSRAVRYGGTGRTFDWKLLPEVRLPFFLAGGLNGDNIEAALAYVRPYAVDISSGVETEGLKDREKILRIVKKVREGQNTS